MERGWLQSLFGTYNIFLYKYKKDVFFISHVDRFSEALEIIQRRNLHVHKKGIVDEKIFYIEFAILYIHIILIQNLLFHHYIIYISYNSKYFYNLQQITYHNISRPLSHPPYQLLLSIYLAKVHQLILNMANYPEKRIKYRLTIFCYIVNYGKIKIWVK